MNDPRDFDFWVENDRIRVRFVGPAVMGRTNEGHMTGGDYDNKRIRLHRGLTRRQQKATLLHELTHYLFRRMDMRAKNTTEEEIVDLAAWLPEIYEDDRNGALLAFLDLRRA